MGSNHGHKPLVYIHGLKPLAYLLGCHIWHIFHGIVVGLVAVYLANLQAFYLAFYLAWMVCAYYQCSSICAVVFCAVES